MIGAIIFVVVVCSLVSKMVYDHQLAKDLQKIREYGQKI
jgi:hypothetical protein